MRIYCDTSTLPHNIVRHPDAKSQTELAALKQLVEKYTMYGSHIVLYEAEKTSDETLRCALLLPRPAMLRELYSTRMSHLQGLKERWRVSMQAIAHRSRDIGIVDEEQYIRFRKQISFKGWQKNEPLDDKIPLEQTQWLLKCWKLLTDRKIVREASLEDELGFSLDLVVRLFGQSAPHDEPLPAASKKIVPLGS